METNDFTIPLAYRAHQLAEDLTQGLRSAVKKERVYLNTLALSALEIYLTCMGFEANWSETDSANPLMVMAKDIADLQVADWGYLVVCPILPEANQSLVPQDRPDSCLGYVMVELDPSLKQATILGFSPQAEETLSRQQVQPLDSLLVHLTQQAQTPFFHRLRDWVIEQNSDLINGWQRLGELFTPAPDLAYQLLDSDQVLESGRGKLFNLGMAVESASMVLIVIVAPDPDSDEHLTVTLKVRPEEDESTLPENLQLVLQTVDGEELQSVTARRQDNWIQLPRFRGEVGERFQVQVCLDEFTMTEAFEL